jgi:uracil-DNA glycosylase
MQVMDLSNLDANDYQYKTWGQYYPDYNVRLDKLPIHKSWKPLFKKSYKKTYWKEVTEYLSFCVNTTKGTANLFPYPELLFSAFNMTPLNEVKVVILGQDPYFRYETHNDKMIPQAMGLSFSVPHNIKIPSSLRNIYKNLYKFNHIDYIPNHGNLSNWSLQGCLMLNASLSVEEGIKNSHADFWNEFTDEVIKYISDKCDNVVFVLWGAFALSKLDQGLIDKQKHKVIVTSHPSGLSNNKTVRSKKTRKVYNAFSGQDQFNEINEYLREHDMDEIDWNV